MLALSQDLVRGCFKTPQPLNRTAILMQCLRRSTQSRCPDETATGPQPMQLRV
jgi:hypothetical protein